jgi:hypothetical protein
MESTIKTFDSVSSFLPAGERRSSREMSAEKTRHDPKPSFFIRRHILILVVMPIYDSEILVKSKEKPVQKWHKDSCGA